VGGGEVFKKGTDRGTGGVQRGLLHRTDHLAGRKGKKKEKVHREGKEDRGLKLRIRSIAKKEKGSPKGSSLSSAQGGGVFRLKSNGEPKSFERAQGVGLEVRVGSKAR